MQVDFLTLACLRDQLDSLLGARVQQVLLPDERSVAVEVYAGQRVHLLASANSAAPRLLVCPDMPRRGVDADTLLLLLLRKWVRGAVLLDVTQPPWERILILHLSGRAGDCQLVVELMGRYSNIVLVGPDGVVLEAVKHVGPTMSRYRTVIPGHLYQLPPLPENRGPPTELTEADWKRKLTAAPLDQVLHRWLVGQALGVSRVLGREIATRATGDPEALVRAATPDALTRAFREILAPLENGWWVPHVALDDAGDVEAFTPYEPRQFIRVEPAHDISQAMWRYYEARGLTDRYAAARQSVQALIDKTAVRLERKLSKLRGSVTEETQVDDLRIAGELLLTYQHQVASDARDVVLTDFEGKPRVITLDPVLTPVQNAQAYFRRYDKARRAADQIPRLIEELQVERAYLTQLDSDLALAESRPEIDIVRDALVVAGWAPKSRKKGGQVSEPRRFEVSGFRIYVGRNARQNEQVTFKLAGPGDLWLHVRGLPGAHVIIRCGRQEVPDDVVQRAAEFAAYYSRARDSETQVPVDVTERRFVRRTRGRFPGMVMYRNERTVWVKGDEIRNA
jgi:predicted ribosome quality control (RQC) complex YloA/Tae2 family protein